MKYFKFDDTYIAINELTDQILQCVNTPTNKTAAVYTDKESAKHFLNKSLAVEEITASEFQNNFSVAVYFLHTETPFA